jgi:hypothetical protein
MERALSVLYGDPATAYVSAPDHVHVYNRLDILVAQGVEAYPLGVRPTKYPVAVVPIVDLGLSPSRLVLRDHVDYEELVGETDVGGRLWTSHDGDEMITDILLLGGERRLVDSARVGRSAGGLLLWWARDAEVPTAALEFVVGLLEGYSGPASFTTRGDVVVDCMLRWSTLDSSWKRSADILACVPHRFECGKQLVAPKRGDVYAACWVPDGSPQLDDAVEHLESLGEECYAAPDGETTAEGYVRVGVIGANRTAELARLETLKREEGWV